MHVFLVWYYVLFKIASSAGISHKESGGGKKFGEMPAINRHKNLHCAYQLAHSNFDKLQLRGVGRAYGKGWRNFCFQHDGF
jgi:hypothetical protein